jgi:chromosome segregation ATPase
MTESEITLTTLYELLQTLAKRVDQRFDRVDQRSDAADKRIDTLESKLDRIDSVQNSIALRLITVETTVREHGILLTSLDTRLNALHGLVEELERRTGRIEQEYVMITEALRRLEGRFDKLEADRLRERIAALEARVQALETAQA